MDGAHCYTLNVLHVSRYYVSSRVLTDQLPDVDDDQNDQQDEDDSNTDWSHNPHQLHAITRRCHRHNVGRRRLQIH